MAVEQRVIGDRPRQAVEQYGGILALLRERSIQPQRVANRRWRFVVGDRTIGNRFEQRRDLIDELMTDLAEALRWNVERTVAMGQGGSLTLDRGVRGRDPGPRTPD